MKYDLYQLAIIFDVTCKETEKVFEEFSRFFFFNASYNWLMFTDDYESGIEVLIFQNINLDAEITFAIADNTSSIRLHDIYKF